MTGSVDENRGCGLDAWITLGSFVRRESGEKGADVGETGKGQIVLRLPAWRYHIGIWFLFSGSKVLASTSAFFPFMRVETAWQLPDGSYCLNVDINLICSSVTL